MSDKTRLRPPLITFDRLKVTAFILFLVWMFESGDPRPFVVSWMAPLAFFALTAELVRQFVVWRMEVSPAAVRQVETWQRGWHRRRDRVDINVRYQIRGGR